MPMHSLDEHLQTSQGAEAHRTWPAKARQPQQAAHGRGCTAHRLVTVCPVGDVQEIRVHSVLCNAGGARVQPHLQPAAQHARRDAGRVRGRAPHALAVRQDGPGARLGPRTASACGACAICALSKSCQPWMRAGGGGTALAERRPAVWQQAGGAPACLPTHAFPRTCDKVAMAVAAPKRSTASGARMRTPRARVAAPGVRVRLPAGGDDVRRRRAARGAHRARGAAALCAGGPARRQGHRRDPGAPAGARLQA